MISYLKGTVLHKTAASVMVEMFPDTAENLCYSGGSMGGGTYDVGLEPYRFVLVVGIVVQMQIHLLAGKVVVEGGSIAHHLHQCRDLGARYLRTQTLWHTHEHCHAHEQGYDAPALYYEKRREYLKPHIIVILSERKILRKLRKIS